MPDHHDEPELAGNGTSMVSEPRRSYTGDATSPSSAHRGSKASDSDPPKKKRKVNHGKKSAGPGCAHD
jgi:hypothetical protein